MRKRLKIDKVIERCSDCLVNGEINGWSCCALEGNKDIDGEGDFPDWCPLEDLDRIEGSIENLLDHARVALDDLNDLELDEEQKIKEAIDTFCYIYHHLEKKKDVD